MASQSELSWCSGICGESPQHLKSDCKLKEYWDQVRNENGSYDGWFQFLCKCAVSAERDSDYTRHKVVAIPSKCKLADCFAHFYETKPKINSTFYMVRCLDCGHTKYILHPPSFSF